MAERDRGRGFDDDEDSGAGVRRPLRQADVVTLQEMDAVSVERIAEDLGMAYVYYPAAGRRAQVAAIVEDARTADAPVVVAGDCNARGGGAAAFQAAGFRWATRDIGRTISLFSWDHVFTRGLAPNPSLKSGAVDSRGASDHRAVWVELPLEPDVIAPASFSTALPAETPAIP